MFPLDAAGVEILLVDFDFLRELSDVRNVDLDGAVPQGLHKLVILQLPVLRFVGMTDNDLINIGLRKLFWLDFVFL